MFLCVCVCVLCLTEDKQNQDSSFPPSQGWGAEGEILAPQYFCRQGVLLVRPPHGSSASDKDFTALPSTAVETDRDRQTHKEKKKKPSSWVCLGSAVPRPEKVRLDYRKRRSRTSPFHKMEHLQTERARARNGAEPKVIGPLTSQIFDNPLNVTLLLLATSLLRASSPTRWRDFIFFFFLNKVFRVRKRWLNQKKYSVFKRELNYNFHFNVPHCLFTQWGRIRRVAQVRWII